jgi:hypothetical protein
VQGVKEILRIASLVVPALPTLAPTLILPRGFRIRSVPVSSTSTPRNKPMALLDLQLPILQVPTTAPEKLSEVRLVGSKASIGVLATDAFAIPQNGH